MKNSFCSYFFVPLFFFCFYPSPATCQNERNSFINLEDFGATGNGSDETTFILKAFQFAKQHKKSIRLINNKTYIFSPSATIDITGIPEISGKGMFDLSKTGKNAGNPSMTAIFQVTGTKKLLQAKVSGMRQNESSLQLTTGLNLAPGDVLFLTSSEPLANMKRPYYAKGQRAIVKTYSNTSGLLITTESFYYSINNVYVWINNQVPKIIVGSQVGFITSPMNFLSCFRLYYADGLISGYYKNFALTAIMFKSSQGEVNNMTADLAVTDNNGYSYCVMVADMSSVNIIKCTLSGGRHVITGGGGGLWLLDESGGKGNAGYPSSLFVDGGIYKGTKNVANINADNATVDSHGIIQKMVIKNCTVYGGINLGGNYVDVFNVIIYTDGKRAFNVGSDVLPGSDWGNYKISNVTIIDDPSNKNSVFFSKADVKELSVDSITVSNLSPDAVIMDFRNNSPKKVFINKISIDHPRLSNFMKINKSSEVKISNSVMSKEAIQRIN